MFICYFQAIRLTHHLMIILTFTIQILSNPLFQTCCTRLLVTINIFKGCSKIPKFVWRHYWMIPLFFPDLIQLWVVQAGRCARKSRKAPLRSGKTQLQILLVLGPARDTPGLPGNTKHQGLEQQDVDHGHRHHFNAPVTQPRQVLEGPAHDLRDASFDRRTHKVCRV